MAQRAVPTRPHTRRDILLTLAMMAITAVASVMLALDLIAVARSEGWQAWTVARLSVLAVVLTVLVSGNVVYAVARLGYLVRSARHDAPTLSTLVEEHWDAAHPIVVLVPSYKEDERTIRQTLTSAAFQHHPRMRVVLLLDDPADPGDDESAALLEAALRLPAQVQGDLAEARGIVESAIDRVHASPGEETRGLGELLRTLGSLASWARHLASAGPTPGGEGPRPQRAGRAADAPRRGHLDEVRIGVVAFTLGVATGRWMNAAAALVTGLLRRRLHRAARGPHRHRAGPPAEACRRLVPAGAAAAVAAGPPSVGCGACH